MALGAAEAGTGVDCASAVVTSLIWPLPLSALAALSLPRKLDMEPKDDNMPILPLVEPEAEADDLTEESESKLDMPRTALSPNPKKRRENEGDVCIV
jgi:hypothetical protein